LRANNAAQNGQIGLSELLLDSPRPKEAAYTLLPPISPIACPQGTSDENATLRFFVRIEPEVLCLAAPIGQLVTPSTRF